MYILQNVFQVKQTDKQIMCQKKMFYQSNDEAHLKKVFTTEM